MNVILLLAPIQAFFLFSLLLAKPRKTFADKVLMAWLVGIGLHTLVYSLHFRFQLSVPLLLNLNSAFPFLQGPFLLAYVVALVGMRQRFAGLDFLQLRWGAINIGDLRGLVTDLTHLENSIGVPIAGIIGFNVLERFQVHFDYAVGALTLYGLDADNRPLVRNAVHKQHPGIPIIPYMAPYGTNGKVMRRAGD